jgi:hypothetical protein
MVRTQSGRVGDKDVHIFACPPWLLDNKVWI